MIEGSATLLNKLRRASRALALLAAFAPVTVMAQLDQAVSDATLLDPWDLERAAVLSLPDGWAAHDAPPQLRSQLDATLRKLDEGLTGFESQVETLITRLVGDPQFPYVAAETSAEMSTQIATIRENFDSLYAALMVQQRADVQAAQASLEALKTTLAQKTPFERDVQRALGSGSRQEILALATRWWAGAERAVGVRKALSGLQQRLAAPAPTQKN